MSDFDKAVADSKKLTSKPSNDELLSLYGTSSWPLHPWHTDGPPLPPRGMFITYVTALFKVANGEDFDSAPTPGMFDLKVRQSRCRYA